MVGEEEVGILARGFYIHHRIKDHDLGPAAVEVIGVDVLNSQLFCMDIEKLGEQFCGKVTFWGEIDRQRLLPFGTP